VNNISVTADNTGKTIPALMQFITNQQTQQQKDFKCKMTRNGIKLK
jgi:hypothetical protein